MRYASHIGLANAAYPPPRGGWGHPSRQDGTKTKSPMVGWLLPTWCGAIHLVGFGVYVPSCLDGRHHSGGGGPAPARLASGQLEPLVWLNYDSGEVPISGWSGWQFDSHLRKLSL